MSTANQVNVAASGPAPVKGPAPAAEEAVRLEPQRVVAGTAAELVNRAARAVCGEAAVRSPSVAEGLALAGRRAASLLDPSGAPPDALETGSAPWVFHHVADGTGASLLPRAVELVADSHQAAVDHAVAAHLLSERLGRPVACRLDRGLAAAPGLARLPVSRALHQWLGERRDETRAAGAARTPDAVVALLAEAGRHMGRPLAAVSPHRLDGAELAIVALGSATGPARVAVERLRASGLRVGLLTLALLRPLPRRELAATLASASRLALVSPGHESPEESELVEALEGLCAEKAGGNRLARLWSDGGAGAGAALVAKLAGLLAVDHVAAPQAAAAAAPGLTLGAMPGGTWGRELVLDLAADLARETLLTVASVLMPEGLAALRVHAPAPGEGSGRTGRVEVLMVAHPAFFDVAAARGTLKEGAAVVFGGGAPDDAALWAALDAGQRALLRELGLVVWRADLREIATEGASLPWAARQMLLGAALRACEAGGWPPEGKGQLVAGVADQLDREDGGADGLGKWLRRGAEAVSKAAAPSEEPAGRGATARPPRLRLAAAEGASTLPWLQLLRRFHLNGPGRRGTGDPSLGLPLEPAALRALLAGDERPTAYPYYVPPEDGATAEETARTLAQILSTAAEGEALPLVGARLPLVLQAVASAVREGGSQVPRAAFEAARAVVGTRFDVSESGRQALQSELDTLAASLPDRGQLLAATPATPLTLYLAAIRRQRGPRVRAFAAKAKELIGRIEQRLAVDRLHGAEASTPEALASGLGAGADLFDPSALASTLPAHRGARRLSAEQTERLRSAAEALRQAIRPEVLDKLVVVHAEPLPAGLDTAGVTTVAHPYPLAAAVGLFDGLGAGWLEAFKAVRVARLELEGAWDAAVHEPLLAEFGWSSCTTEELGLLPRVVAVERAERVRRAELAALGQLLDSGRPVNAVLLEGTLGAPGAWPGELGRTALAHGDAFVLQSSLARPDELWSGFSRIGEVSRPAVAIVTMPPFGDTVPAELLAEASLEGRAAPCFRYDPDGGRDLADQLELGGNPWPSQGWTSRVLALGEEADADLDAIFTWADVAALHPSHRHHFWAVPAEAWSDEQVELAEFLADGAPEARQALPYIWVVDEGEQLSRAIVTRELALQAWDRLRAWHALQELGGIDNAYARRAAEEARERALAGAEKQREALESVLREEIEQVRTQTAGEAIDRLVASLLNLDVSQAAALVPASAPAPAKKAPAKAEAPAEAKAEAAPAPVEAEEDEGLGFDQPYIDSFLCTTCNECTGINPVMFQYNADKQAYITDASAGTFAELVQAAQKCPARCIHPGKPRAGDATATPDAVAAAAEFQ